MPRAALDNETVGGVDIGEFDIAKALGPPKNNIGPVKRGPDQKVIEAVAIDVTGTRDAQACTIVILITLESESTGAERAEVNHCGHRCFPCGVARQYLITLLNIYSNV
jgi:hypothetical protein